MDPRYVKRNCLQHHHHPQFAQPRLKMSHPQEDGKKGSDGKGLRKRPPIPVPPINFQQEQQTVINHENKTSQSKDIITEQRERERGKVPGKHIPEETSNNTPHLEVSARTPPLPTIRITTPEVQKRRVAACRSANNRKDSFDSKVPPRPRKYSSSSASSGQGVSNRPVPSKRRHLSQPLPPPLPPRVPLNHFSISENDLLRHQEDRPPLPPKPASLSNFQSKSETELFSFSESVFLELSSRHNSFNSPPPLPPKVVARQPLPAIRRSTVSLEEKSVFDLDFDFLSDMPNRRGTTGAESILRARYREEKARTGCCTECSKDCIVDTPECLMDIFC